MSQALYRKWRPARFSDVIGQEHITHTLQNSVGGDQVGHAYLFCGPRGTGKTTSARLLAKAVNCLGDDPGQRPCNNCSVCRAINDGRFLDLIEIDAASNTGVDDMRDLRDKVNFAPSEGRFKVYIIDEVHMLSTAAFNALLKTLEEPPAHVKFILATTEEHKVPMTIKSRCQQFNFRLLTSKEINGRLRWLAEKEGLTVEPAAFDLIAQQGAGSLRDAESLMDQLITSPDDPITLERTQMVLGTATEQSIALVTGAWLTGSSGEGLRVIHDALSSGADARQFARQMVAYLRELLLLKAAGDALPLDGTPERKQAMLAQVNRTSTSALVRAVKAFNEAAMATTSSWQPQLPLELAYISLMAEVLAVLPMETAVSPTAAIVPPAATAAATAAPTAIPQEVPVNATPSPPPAQKRAAVAKSPPPPQSEPEDTPEPITETAPSPPNSQPITLDAVRGNWREMVGQVGLQIKSLPALLNMGKPIALEGNVIIIGFDYPIFKDKFDKEVKAASLINQTYSNLLNSTCTVRGVVTSEYAVPVQEEEVRKLAKELGGVVRIKN